MQGRRPHRDGCQVDERQVDEPQHDERQHDELPGARDASGASGHSDVSLQTRPPRCYRSAGGSGGQGSAAVGRGADASGRSRGRLADGLDLPELGQLVA